MDSETKSLVSFVKMLGLCMFGLIATVAAIKFTSFIVEVAFK